jgi:DNA repair ATPase RecN
MDRQTKKLEQLNQLIMKENDATNSILAYRHNAQELLMLCDKGLLSNRDYEEEKEDLERQYLAIREQISKDKIALLDQFHKEVNDELYPPQGRNSMPR